MSNTLEQHKIVAEVEVGCALKTMSIKEGLQKYNENGLQNAGRELTQYVNAMRERLLNGTPAYMRCAGTNAKATFTLLFEMNNKKYIENFITALENEMEVQSNKKVLAEVEQAKIKLN
jgi:hypothetical protein